MGVRPMPQPPLPVPMSNLENKGSFERGFDLGWKSPVDESNLSPFTRNPPALVGLPQATVPKARSPNNLMPARGLSLGPWTSSAPENPPHTNFSSTINKAFGGFGHGQGGFSSIVGGHETTQPPGNRSGTSSRRHSVSIVNGPGGRRDIFAEMGMTTSPSGRGIGPIGFNDEDFISEKLGNALSLEIDEYRKRGVEIEVGKDGDQRGGEPIKSMSGSLPKFGSSSETLTRGNGFSHQPIPFDSPPGRGREPGSLPITGGDKVTASRDSSSRSRFNFDDPQFAAGARATNGPGSLGGGQYQSNRSLSSERGREVDPVGPVGTGLPHGPGFPGSAFSPGSQRPFPPPFQPRSEFTPRSGGMPGTMPSGLFGPTSPPLPNPFPQHRPPPHQPTMGYSGRPIMGGFAGSPVAFSPPGGGFSPQFSNYPYYPNPQPPVSPVQPHSPSFSQLSLADLGKGTPLGTLPPNTPLYVVLFKAGRRDVYYCPDPTLLISNGDRVIVEADRGSDLGTVVYDQLTPVDVREWQERSATATLLSGASQHQPPGMLMSSQSGGIKKKPSVGGAGELAGMDLNGLLAGVGAQVDPSVGLGNQGRGPLAKEIMPKRIFAKSAQGPEEQASVSVPLLPSSCH